MRTRLLWVGFAWGCAEPRLDETKAEETPISGADAEVVNVPGTAPPDESGYLFEDGIIREMHLSLSEEAIASLATDPRTDVEARLTFEEETFVVGLHLKGTFSFRDLDGKASFKVDFGEYFKGANLRGLRRLTLNSMVQDRSMIREHVAYWMYARLGVPVPRHSFVSVTVNGAPYGLYGLLETLDKNWVERTWPADPGGWLYEGKAVNLSEWGGIFDVQADGAGEPRADLDALIDVLDETEPSTFADVLEARFETDRLLAMWAHELVMGHRDGYPRSHNNYLLYHAPMSDRWWMIPWGQDQTFRDSGGVYTGWAGRLIRACRDAVACKQRLDGVFVNVIEAWEEADLAGYATATGEAITAACEADPRKELECGYDSVIDYILDRPAEVRTELGVTPQP